jgi:hypothetical protein
MSAPAARTFLPQLRDVERRLPLPVRRRVRILRELEYDLEELYARFLAEGLAPEVARARALEALVPADEALRALGRVHAPAYKRATGLWGEARLRRFERAALTCLALLVLAGESLLLLGTDLLRDPSPFLWPVLALGALLLTNAATLAFRLWSLDDARADPPRLASILVLSALALATAFGGVLVDTFRLAAAVEREPGRATAATLAWLVSDASLVAVALLIVLAGGLSWFLLSQWQASVRAAHREALGMDARTPQPPHREIR